MSVYMISDKITPYTQNVSDFYTKFVLSFAFCAYRFCSVAEGYTVCTCMCRISDIRYVHNIPKTMSLLYYAIKKLYAIFYDIHTIP